MPRDRGDGDRLSRVASALLALARAADEAHADVDAHYAPSECHRLVSRAFGLRALAIARAHGFVSLEEVEDAVAARTCARVAHDLGFGTLAEHVASVCRDCGGS